MPFVCIPKENAQKFKEALKEGKISLADLMTKSTEDRTTLLSKYMDEATAKDANLLIEEKLVLKNKIQGIKNAISKIGQIGRYDPKKQAKLDAALADFRKQQQARIFNPSEEQAFLGALAEKVLGTEITRQEAKTIFDMNAKSDVLREKYDPVQEQWATEKDRIEYATTKALTEKYVDDLKAGKSTVQELLKDYGAELRKLWGENKPKTVAKFLTDAVTTVSNTLINAVASWDNSFLGRQGGITLVKSPKIWWNMASKSFEDIKKTLGGADMQTYLLKQDMLSRPNGMNGNYDTAKLFPKTEEEVPTKILEKLPIAGRLFKASDVAFTNSAIRARADLFDMMLNLHKKTGLEADKKIVEDLGTVVNAITARGKVGQIGSSKPVQLLMWAPRMLKADWDVLTGHTFGKGLETNFARKQAAKTIAQVVIGTAGVVAVAQAMGADVEKNPLSSDFMRIKIGNTRIQVPFVRGMPAIVTLLSRIATQKSKSTVTGITTDLNSGDFGSKTLFDVGLDFLTNKTTPPAKVVIDWFKGKNFEGQKPTVGSVAFGTLPISVQNFVQLKDEATVASVSGAFLDLFGVGSNTYSAKTDWTQNIGAELTAFQDKIGARQFQQANDQFNKEMNNWLASVKENPTYVNLSADDQQKVITKKKSEVKDAIFKQYGFKYTPQKSKPLPKL